MVFPQTDSVTVTNDTLSVLSDSLSVDSLMVDSDSLLYQAAVPPVEWQQSIFLDHRLQPDRSMQNRPLADNGSLVVFGLILISGAVLAYLQRNSDGFFRTLLKESFDHNLAMQDARMENSQRNRNITLSQFTAFISYGLFISAIVQNMTEIRMATAALFVKIIFVFVGLFVLKRSVLWVLSFIFETGNLLKIQSFNLNLFLTVSGLALLPLNLLIFYSPQVPVQILLYVGIVIAAFFYLKGVIRGISLALNNRSLSALHLFYYLCALEILPVFVLVRTVQQL